MTIKREKSGEYLVLDLQGDFRGGEESFAELRQMGHGALAESPFLALDCRHVTFLDSQTLGLLVEFLRSAQTRGGGMLLIGVTERVAKWFELSGLDRIFEMVPVLDSLPEARPASPPARHREVLDAVDVDQMVSELRAALGEADEHGAPTAPGPGEEKMLSEIERLLGSLEEEPG